MALQNNVVYKGVLATLGAIHLAGYTAVTGDTTPLMQVVNNITNSTANMTTTASRTPTMSVATAAASMVLANGTSIATTDTPTTARSTATTAKTTCAPTTNAPATLSATAATSNGIHSVNDFDKLINATGTFVLNQDIDATNTTSIDDFKGRLEGQGHTVSGLTNCLFHNLKGEVRDIKFTNANITSHHNRTNDAFGVGVVACHLDKTGRLDNIHVSNSNITVHGENKVAGAIVGSSHGQLNHVHSANNRVVAESEILAVGGISGEIIQGSLSHSTVVENNIIAINHDSHAGGITGAVEGAATVSHVHVHDTLVETFGRSSRAGGVAGMLMGNSQYAHVSNSTVIAGGASSHAGGITGNIRPQSVVTDSQVTYSTIQAQGNNSLAGGIAALSRGNAIHALAANSTIITKGIDSHAGGIIGHNANFNESEEILTEIMFGEEGSANFPEDTYDSYSDYNETDFGYEPDEYYSSLNAARQGNTKGIINLAVSETNNIRAEGLNSKADGLVAVDEGIIFDSNGIDNNVTTNGVSEDETTSTKTFGICEDQSAGLTNLQTAAIVAAGTVVLNSYYNGWREGERGLKLALRPLRSAANGVLSVVNYAKSAAAPQRTNTVEIAFSSVQVEDTDVMQSTSGSTSALYTNE